MNKKHAVRVFIIASFFIFLWVALLWRVVDLTVIHRQFLQGQGNARSVRVVDVPAYRGIIVDRNGAPLAVSTPVKSLWVNPKLFTPTSGQLKALSCLLQIPEKTLTLHVKKAAHREFLYLRRQLTPRKAKQIADLKIAGLNFQQEFKRYYPAGETSAQLLGFTNIDDEGIEGVEFAYQQWLMGSNGKKRVAKDRRGQVIAELGVLREPHPGHELMLSIDQRIQYLAYQALNNTLKKFAAKSGSVIVMDSMNGEILAIANAPSFNPNARGHYSEDRYRNRAATDLFEPGSVIKPFSVASALSSGRFKPETLIDTNPSWMQVQGKTIRDVHSYGVLDVTGVLQHSSNVGITKMVLSQPPEHLIHLFQSVGLGQRTESGFPGESEGSIVHVKDANPFVLATLGFGYGVSVTGLQLAKAYGVFANQGRLLPLSFLHDKAAENVPVQGQAVIDEKTAKQVLIMMESVLGNEGTGKLARVPGYRVAGKTGTARIASKNGYEVNRHIASFVGIAPVSQPRLVVAAVIFEPTMTSYYGAAVAAPLFSEVMKGALRILDIAPDHPDQLYSS